MRGHGRVVADIGDKTRQRRQILLALDGFNKKTQKTPWSTIDLAKRYLADWRKRGDQKRIARGGRPLHG
jgi:hypothetical protein